MAWLYPQIPGKRWLFLKFSQINNTMLEKVRRPVARIEAQYRAPISQDEGAKVNSEYRNGLEHVLHLSVGSRVYSTFFKFNLTLGHVDKKYMAVERVVQWSIGDSARIGI